MFVRPEVGRYIPTRITDTDTEEHLHRLNYILSENLHNLGISSGPSAVLPFSYASNKSFLSYFFPRFLPLLPFLFSQI